MTLHPVDHFNFFGSFEAVCSGKDFHMITPNEAALLSSEYPNRATYEYSNGLVKVIQDNPHGFNKGGTISLFQLLTAVQFKHDQQAAISYIMFDLMELEIPYIRVGTDYFKVIKKADRYGAIQTHLKPWGKEEIKQDHARTFLAQIPKFDDFIIIPDNKDYKPVAKNCYNLYSEFAHVPHSEPVTREDIATSLMFLKHIFGDQLNLGLKYMKILYEYPKQILPILTLVSKERDTGKTTFINWMEMIFGGNSILIAPEDLLKSFNSSYATKNIVLVDETFIEKQSGVEKLKSLSTAKSVTVSQKHVSEYPIPLYIKVILCTNKVKDFMKIDSDEVRFWIRSIPSITGKKNVKIEEQLFNEIPKFLRFLSDLEPINFDTGSRMYFTKEEIGTDALMDVKEESKSTLHKEIEMKLEEFFGKHRKRKSMFASAIDIKESWFSHNNQISASYIRKVLTEEMGLKKLSYQRYYPLETMDSNLSKPGYPFEFLNDKVSEDQL